MSLIKFYYDIARPENSENFHGYLSLHQNTRTKQFKVRQNAETSFGKYPIVHQCVQKWNKLPYWLQLAKKGNVFKKTLNDFMLSQHEKIPLNSSIGAFKSYFYFYEENNRKKFLKCDSLKNLLMFIVLFCLNDLKYFLF